MKPPDDPELQELHDNMQKKYHDVIEFFDKDPAVIVSFFVHGLFNCYISVLGATPKDQREYTQINFIHILKDLGRCVVEHGIDDYPSNDQETKSEE